MKQIPLNQGKFAIVDDEDYPVLNRFTLSINTGYNSFPRVCFKAENNVTYNIPITRFLFDTYHFSKTGYMPVPKDGNYLNCSKANITFVFNSIRRQRSAKTMNLKTSKYKGVCKANRQPKCWRGYIKTNEKQYAAYFYTEKEAALWYNERAIELFGDLAYQNIITE